MLIAREARPLALFDGPRTDFSLARLKHYTGTPAEDFQHFVLFTNYVRYVDEFIAFATTALGSGEYSRLSAPGASYESGDPADLEAQIAAGPWRKFQMPAYHLVREDRTGITLVNIGVGPSNAKTICDHVAVLRPEVWLMIGHCGGLRERGRQLVWRFGGVLQALLESDSGRRTRSAGVAAGRAR